MRLSHLYRTFFAGTFSLLDIACVFIDFITISSTPFGAMNAILVVSCKWLEMINRMMLLILQLAPPPLKLKQMPFLAQ